MHVPFPSPGDIIDAADRKERLARFLNEHNPSMSIIVDGQQVVRYVTVALCRLLGYHIDEMMGGRFTLQSLLGATGTDTARNHAAWVERWFQNPRPITMHSRGPVPVRRSDGSDVWALVSLLPYIDEQTGTLILSEPPKFTRYGVAFILPVPDIWAAPPPKTAAPAAGGRTW